jgi:hypothetical protein
VAELCRLVRLLWRYRRLARGGVVAYAQTALQAQEEVARLRRDFPGRQFCWSFQPQPLDSPAVLISVYEYARRGANLYGPGRLPPFLRRLWHGSIRDIVSGEVDLAAVVRNNPSWDSTQEGTR